MKEADRVANLSGLSLCVFGGDRREVELVSSLIDSGAHVSCFGTPAEGLRSETVIASSARDACAGADAVILPLSGTDMSGNVKITSRPVSVTRELLATADPTAMVFSGVVRPCLAADCAALGLRVVNMGEDDELAILNSIPSAEGAILMAMQATPFTIHNSNCLVLGPGRTGITLARMLQGLCAHVWGASRKASGRARLFEMGVAPVDFADLPHCLPQMDIVFNTVPAPVLDRSLVYVLKRTAVIIDLASAPGGVDFVAAAERGIRAELAPGLPGKVAPLTAGRILARVVPRIIEDEFRKREREIRAHDEEQDLGR
jgi:dipicolinate synthase subunit A